MVLSCVFEMGHRMVGILGCNVSNLSIVVNLAVWSQATLKWNGKLGRDEMSNEKHKNEETR